LFACKGQARFLAHKDHQTPFDFTGKISRLTFKLGPQQLVAADQQAVQKRLARATD
jgi:hypothetical protein